MLNLIELQFDVVFTIFLCFLVKELSNGPGEQDMGESHEASISALRCKACEKSKTRVIEQIMQNS